MTDPINKSKKSVEAQDLKEAKEQTSFNLKQIRHPVLIADNFDPLSDYYKSATLCRLDRFHGSYAYGAEERMGQIIKEIKYRVKICKKEIFEIGALLTEAKQIVGHGKFKPWIEDNFDFSYETANNFMNVYKTCLANPNLVTSLKASVLYQIASPGFPTDLRQYIFEHVDDVYTWKDTPVKLEEITNNDLRELLMKYKAGELDTDSNEIRKLIEQHKKISQFGYVLDQLELCLRVLEKYRDNISTVKTGYKYCGYFSTMNTGQNTEVGNKIFKICKEMDDFIEKLTLLMGDLEKMAE
jgi:hypothetical protein